MPKQPKWKPAGQTCTSLRRGFTLVEIMIVVALIGLLAALAFPSMRKARNQSRINAFISDLRVCVDSFSMYAMNNESYPPDALRTQIPPGMADYLDQWPEHPLNAEWDWDYNTVGIVAGVSSVASSAPVILWEEVDRKIDDGNLGSGNFQFINADRYTWIIEP